jgi:oxygen-independent coproporphyrinogen-3 oxidase
MSRPMQTDAPARALPGTAPLPPRLDRGLARRYDRPVPRYTSYPPATRFVEGFGPAGYRGLLEASAAGGRDLSLYVHLPFCAARCLFCGCNVTIARDRTRAATYLRALEAEATEVAALAGAGRRRVVQAHWGGGTPTFLPAEQLRALDALLRERFDLAADAEIGVEVDPRHCTAEQLDALAAAGVNRLSVGLQDLDPRVQQAVRRIQPLEQVREVVAGARARGIASVNVDLIYGLPHQTAESFDATLAEVLRLAPDRLALFGFAYLPRLLAHQRALDPAALPSAERRWEILALAIGRLAAAGYLHVGLDHFALPGDPLALALAEGTMGRNFQGYTTHADCDLVGLGASAIGQLGGGYAQNARGVGEYQAAVAARGLATVRGLVLTRDDELRRHVISRLLCACRLDYEEVEARFGIDFSLVFAPELERLRPLADDGLVELAAGALVVTPLGRLLVRTVASVFDAEQDRPAHDHARAV